MHPTFERLSREISQEIEGMSPAELAHSPAAGVWSCAMVLEHLCRTYMGTVKGMDRVLQANAPLATALPLKWRLAQFVVLDLGRFPKGRKSPVAVEPLHGNGETIRADFFEQLALMDTKLTEGEQRFGRNVKILDHPVLKALTVAQWRKFHLVHAEHHAKQLRERKELAQKAFAAAA